MTTRQFLWSKDLNKYVRITERVTTFGPRGEISSIIFERRDQFGRPTYISTETMKDTRLETGAKQRRVYRNNTDKTGRQTLEAWDRALKRWVKRN